MLLLDLAHLHVLPELGQAVMANCTCLLLRDRHGSGRLRTICSKNELKKETGGGRRFTRAAARMANPIKCSVGFSCSWSCLRPKIPLSYMKNN